MIDDSIVITKLYDEVAKINDKLDYYDSLFETPKDECVFYSLNDLMKQLRVIKSFSNLQVEELCFYLIIIDEYLIVSTPDVRIKFSHQIIIFTKDSKRFQSLNKFSNIEVFSDKSDFFECVSTLIIKKSKLDTSNDSKITSLFRSKREQQPVIMCLKLFKNENITIPPPNKDFGELYRELSIKAANDNLTSRKVA